MLKLILFISLITASAMAATEVDVNLMLSAMGEVSYTEMVDTEPSSSAPINSHHFAVVQRIASLDLGNATINKTINQSSAETVMLEYNDARGSLHVPVTLLLQLKNDGSNKINLNAKMAANDVQRSPKDSFFQSIYKHALKQISIRGDVTVRYYVPSNATIIEVLRNVSGLFSSAQTDGIQHSVTDELDDPTKPNGYFYVQPSSYVEQKYTIQPQTFTDTSAIQATLSYNVRVMNQMPGESK